MKMKRGELVSSKVVSVMIMMLKQNLFQSMKGAEVVRYIFDRYVHEITGSTMIARELNEQGIT